MSGLKDFQQHTVNYVFHQLYVLERKRLLVADEVGLGKTFIAKGIIEKILEDYTKAGKLLKVVYVCSNQNIARQNLSKLNVTNDKAAEQEVSRLSLLALKKYHLPPKGNLHLMPLSPNTSMKIARAGWVKERAIIYNILLKNDAFNRHKARLHTILRNEVNKGTFDYYANGECSLTEIDEGIISAFNRILNYGSRNTSSLFNKLKFEIPLGTKRNDKLIAGLRELLSTVCLDILKPDLIILDEFQRFKDLLQNETTSEIARTLFDQETVKVLLLSATPYKMFTIQSEEDDGVNHYREFLKVLEFLMSEETYKLFEERWLTYSNGLIKYRDPHNQVLQVAKRAVEAMLREVMCRTERIQVSDDYNAMISKNEILLEPDGSDFNSFKIADSFAAFFSSEERQILRPIEFCKSVPYPLSFMDNYVLKKELEKEKNKYEWRKDFTAAFEKSKGGWLLRSKIKNYDELHFPNVRFKKLLELNVNRGAQLLFLPPSLPYYPLSGVFSSFNEERGFSKSMIFSDLILTPKTIAALVSYEIERQTIAVPNDTMDDKDEEGMQDPKTRKYFIENEKKRKPLPRLIFRKAKDGIGSLMLFTLLHPSAYLASLFDPVDDLSKATNSKKGPVYERITKQLQKDIDKLNPTKWIARKRSGIDERWYWVLPMILDVVHFPKVVKCMKRDNQEKGFFKTKSNNAAAQEQFEYAYNTVLWGYYEKRDDRFIRNLNLGELPPFEDLINNLAFVALGSPSICFYRSLKALFPESGTNVAQTSYLLYKAQHLTEVNYLSYLNTPEHLAVLEQHHKIRGQFWLTVATYHADGCFQSVSDEFFYLVKEQVSGNTFNSVVEAVCSSIGNRIHLHTASVTVDTFESFRSRSKPDRMRTHYAVGFYAVNDKEEVIDRKSEVQNKFNSPFRPFILATTSIGQEGLDFHLYCRNLVHWNLPSNPVDLEQREGRVNRYMNHAVRLSVAAKYLQQIDSKGAKSIWAQLFEIADRRERINGKCELVPYWHIEDAQFKINRILPLYPLSKETMRINNLLKTLSLYRVALGQPRQEELIEFLLKDADPELIEAIRTQLLINLSPIAHFESSALRKGKIKNENQEELLQTGLIMQ